MADRLRRMVVTASGWMAIWTVAWLAFAVALRVADPDSLDPGEGRGMLLILGSMGLLSAMGFSGLYGRGARRTNATPSARRVLTWGALAAGVVQLLFLGHGDRGIAANLLVALLFVAVGVLVTLAWVGVGAWMSRRRRAAR